MNAFKPRHFLAAKELPVRSAWERSPRDEKGSDFMSPFSLERGAAKPAEPRLIPSADGQIARILLTIPGYAVEYSAYSNVYVDLLARLPKSAELVILTSRSVVSVVQNWIELSGRTAGSVVIDCEDHLRVSVWAQDGYAVMEDSNSGFTYFVEPFSFPRYADSLVADLVSHATELRSTQAPLYFQGGNILIGDTFFFIGIDYPTNSLQYAGNVFNIPEGEDPQKFVKQLYQRYLDTSRDLIYVESSIPVPEEEYLFVDDSSSPYVEVVYYGNRMNTRQPLFHIDMFLTLAGRDLNNRYRVLVGDPRLAAQMLNVPESPYSMQRVFDDIARQLSDSGFEVIRNPLPSAYVDETWKIDLIQSARDQGKKGADVVLSYMEDQGLHEIPVRLHYFATANNAIVENSAAGRRVLLPSYGHGSWPELAATDLANKKIWSDLGFDVQLLQDFHPFAQNLGAVHCITKYLKRI